MQKVRLDELTSSEVHSLFNSPDIKIGILLPIGSTEQHGPYLPLGCDMLIARKSAENLALSLCSNNSYRAVVLPDFSYTPCFGAETLPGSISVGFDWMGNGLCEVVKGALNTPWDFVAIVNAHAFNHGRVIETSIAGINGRLGRKIPIVILNVYAFSQECNGVGLDAGNHAGEFELALYKYYKKDFTPPNYKLSPRQVRKRPSEIFGLDIMPRSFDGVLAITPPSVVKAMSKAEELGLRVDNKIKSVLLENLNTYFAYWEHK